MPSTTAPADQTAVEVPLYTPLDVARYLHVPVWVALAISTRRFHPGDLFELFWHVPRPSARFADDYGLVLRGDEPQRISFRWLAGLFVSSAVLRPIFVEGSLLHPHPEAVIHLFELSHRATAPLVEDARLFTDPDWVLPHFDRLLADFREWASEPDRDLLLKRIALFQSRVEVQDSLPIRFFPFSREPATGAPQTVVIDPELRFGRPTVKGVPTDMLVDRWRAGDSAVDLADDYGLTTEEVEESLRYETVPAHLPFLFPYQLVG